MWLSVVLGGLVIVLLFLYLLLTRKYGTLNNCGFPVIDPSLCFGSGPFAYHKTNLINIDTKRFEKYGKVFGAYLLSNPWVYIADPELIKQITIKDFEYFPQHYFEFHQQKYRSIESTSGKEWKELRKALSPVFTSGKLKSMIGLIDGALDNMINYLNKEVNRNPIINIKDVLKCLTMDSIGLCAFGVNLNCFENTNNPIFEAAKQSFDEFMAVDAMGSIGMNLAWGMAGFEKIFDFVTPGIVKLWDYVRKIQNERARSGEKKGDFIDRLTEMKDVLVTGDGTITEEQLTAQGMIFFLAGFETTAHTMGSLCYMLAKNPEVLETLLEEIDSVPSDNFDHDAIADLPYLEACIKEAMRLVPAVGRNDRKCVKDWEYKGIKIKKGTCLGLLNYVIHHNPEYYPEPELFKPERFFKENLANIKPCSYLPFGSGPRACIGERFAMVEMKLAMTKLLQNFRIESTDQTRLEFLKGSIFMSSYGDIIVRIVPRK